MALQVGVRLRATVGAVLVVSIALAIVGGGLWWLLRHQVYGSMADAARRQVDAVATSVQSSGFTLDLTPGPADQSLVQVLRGSSVAAASPEIAGVPPLVSTRPTGAATVSQIVRNLPTEEDTAFAVAVRRVVWQDETGYVIAAQPLDAADSSIATAGWLLLGGYPLVLLLVGATTHWVTGRALSPVERIRARVAGIADTADVSERVPVPDSTDEIARLATTMNHMLDRIDAVLAAQRRFISDASHELRTPLATIRARHEVAAAHPTVSDWPTEQPEILADLDRLDRLVADLLLLARTDEAPLKLRPAPLSLDDLIRAESGRIAHDGRLSVSVEAEPVTVVADAHHLDRAVRNLLDNAQRHARGSVSVSVHAVGSEAVVEVCDDGSGIPRPDRERIFERFVRLDDSRARAAGGTGLGLPIARRIARAHGGWLRALEPVGEGARLVLTLPLEAPPAPGP